MACWNCLFGFVLAFWTILGSNHAFPDGAPESACKNMLPVHIGVQPQTVPCPYELSVSTPSFRNGQLVNVLWKSSRGHYSFQHQLKNESGLLLAPTSLTLSPSSLLCGNCGPITRCLLDPGQIQSDLEKSSSDMWNGSIRETIFRGYGNCLLATHDFAHLIVFQKA
ncbi:hypothetical protein E2320_013061 [Naja naja]|nr:hypothetical protein E2320_013061 [Naja naja]